MRPGGGGQREPITLCDGMILDGRNRYRACVELDIDPLTRDYAGDPWAFAWSLNGARRDLEATVRALIFKRCEDGSAKWAKRLARIAEEGNRKKSDAAKEQHAKSNPRRGETLVPSHDDMAPKRSKANVALPARAPLVEAENTAETFPIIDMVFLLSHPSMQYVRIPGHFPASPVSDARLLIELDHHAEPVGRPLPPNQRAGHIDFEGVRHLDALPSSHAASTAAALRQIGELVVESLANEAHRDAGRTGHIVAGAAICERVAGRPLLVWSEERLHGSSQAAAGSAANLISGQGRRAGFAHGIHHFDR